MLIRKVRRGEVKFRCTRYVLSSEHGTIVGHGFRPMAKISKTAGLCGVGQMLIVRIDYAAGLCPDVGGS